MNDQPTYRVRCSKCGEIKPRDQTNVISTGSGFGRAYRCDPCGIAESRRITDFNIRLHHSDCQDCRHVRDHHVDPGGCTLGDCACMEFLPSQVLELWEIAQEMRDDPAVDPGWPFVDLIHERGWDR